MWNFKQGCVGVRNILHDTVDAKRKKKDGGEGKEEEERETFFTNISHLFIFLQQRAAQQRFKISLGGISFDSPSRFFFASIKILCKLKLKGRGKKNKKKAFRVCGMAKIRSKFY